MTDLSSYRKRPHWSASSLNQLLSICGLQFRLQRIDKLRPEFTSLPLPFGGVCHRVMEWIALNRMDGSVPSTSDAEELFSELWKRECVDTPDIRFGDKATPESCGDQGRSMCAAYIESIDPKEEILEINRAFAVPVGDHDKPLIGELDCIARKGKDTYVLDWKSAARRWPEKQADQSLQATAYLYAMRQLEPESRYLFAFDVITKAKTPTVTRYTTHRADDDFRRLEALVAMAERIVQHDIFVPADGSMYCGGCPHQTACKSWHNDQAPGHVSKAA